MGLSAALRCSMAHHAVVVRFGWCGLGGAAVACSVVEDLDASLLLDARKEGCLDACLRVLVGTYGAC